MNRTRAAAGDRPEWTGRNKSDEQVGREILASLFHGTHLEAAAASDPPKHPRNYLQLIGKATSKQARALREYEALREVSERHAESFMGAIVEDPDMTLYHLGCYLALRRDFGRAGKAHRTYFEVVYPGYLVRRGVERRPTGFDTYNLEKARKRLANEAVWGARYDEIRARPNGKRRSTSSIAKDVADALGGSAETIRKYLGRTKRQAR